MPNSGSKEGFSWRTGNSVFKSRGDSRRVERDVRLLRLLDSPTEQTEELTLLSEERWDRQ